MASARRRKARRINGGGVQSPCIFTFRLDVREYACRVDLGLVRRFASFSCFGIPVFLTVYAGDGVRVQIGGPTFKHHLAGLQTDDAIRENFGQFDIVNIQYCRKVAFAAQFSDKP